jgi:hypothetical protein
MSCPLKLLVTQLTFSMSLADTLGKLLGKPRHMTLLGISSLVLFPLCLKRVPKSLAPFSLAGVLRMRLYGVGRDASVLGWLLCVLAAQVSSNFMSSFGYKGMASVLAAESRFSVYMAHYNPSPCLSRIDAKYSLSRYHQVVGYSSELSIVLMTLIILLGYLNIEKSSSGLVLSNYTTLDKWMSGRWQLHCLGSFLGLLVSHNACT